MEHLFGEEKYDQVLKILNSGEEISLEFHHGDITQLQRRFICFLVRNNSQVKVFQINDHTNVYINSMYHSNLRDYDITDHFREPRLHN